MSEFSERGEFEVGETQSCGALTRFELSLTVWTLPFLVVAATAKVTSAPPSRSRKLLTFRKLTPSFSPPLTGVQNLRKAIYQFKLITEACELSTPKYHANFTRAVNYLYRYGSLIVFAAYLLEKASVELESEEEEEEGGEGESGRLKPFKEWLRDRREVGQILSRKSLD